MSSRRSEPDEPKRPEAKGCAACGYSGWRQLAWHRYNGVGAHVVDEFVAPCLCPRGARIAQGPDVDEDYQRCADRLRAQPRTIRVVVDPRAPEDRLSADELEAHRARVAARGAS